MAAIAPYNVNAPAFDRELRLTPEFKAYLEQILERVGGVTGGSYAQLTDGPTIQWDVGRLPCVVVVLGGSRAIANPTGMIAGPLFPYRIRVVQDATGGRTLTFGSAYKFAGGTPPVVASAPNAVSQFVFDSDGTNMYLIGGGLDYL